MFSKLKLNFHPSLPKIRFKEISNLKFCIIFNMISSVNYQGSVKIGLACSKTLLLTISCSNIVPHPNSYMKDNKYFFFYKNRCGKCSPEPKLFTMQSRDTKQKDHIYHTKQIQTFYGKIKCDLLNLRGVERCVIRILRISQSLFIFS